MYYLVFTSFFDNLRIRSFRYGYKLAALPKIIFQRFPGVNCITTLSVQFHTFYFCTEKKITDNYNYNRPDTKESVLLNSANVFLFLSSTDQIVPSIWSLNCSPTSDLPDHIERYSRKVFVGGLPPDIDEGTVTERVYIIAP